MLLFGITAAVWFIIASYFGLIGNAMSDVLINQSWSDINKYVDSALNDVNNTINGEIKKLHTALCRIFQSIYQKLFCSRR